MEVRSAFFAKKKLKFDACQSELKQYSVEVGNYFFFAPSFRMGRGVYCELSFSRLRAFFHIWEIVKRDRAAVVKGSSRKTNQP